MTQPEAATTVLLMLSGGVDSTWLLHHYLGETNQRVHAHHISMRYPHQERWRAEDPACERIVAWCRENMREFEYSTSRFDLDFHRIGWDSDLQLLVASKVALNLGPGPITLALGWCAEDLERPRVRERQERGVTPALWRALCESAGRPNLTRDIAMPIVERRLSKADLVAQLPDDLLELTWSCRSPVFTDGTARPCGRCHACGVRRGAPSPYG
jgi:7-cyano-7-deazaguanine synthase in queuosine biosynthesis